LNNVDFPTFGNPTIPAFINLILSGANIRLSSNNKQVSEMKKHEAHRI
ncbi:MAG: hypothetical protein ACI87F_000261, partial [Candidatus Azotimanducaceae bacterium]